MSPQVVRVRYRDTQCSIMRQWKYDNDLNRIVSNDQTESNRR